VQRCAAGCAEGGSEVYLQPRLLKRTVLVARAQTALYLAAGLFPLSLKSRCRQTTRAVAPTPFRAEATIPRHTRVWAARGAPTRGRASRRGKRGLERARSYVPLAETLSRIGRPGDGQDLGLQRKAEEGGRSERVERTNDPSARVQ
jgi:hypothetical protein